MSSTRSPGVRGTAGELSRQFLAGTNLYQRVFIVSTLLALLTVPLWGRGYLYLFALANVWAILAMGWDIISGHTGYISFGHSALSGAGAYTTAMLIYNVDPEVSMFVTVPLSVIVAVLIGMTFALPSLRLRGPYFSVMTLVVVLVFTRLVYIYGDYTGGELGITGVHRLSFDRLELFYMTLVPMLVIGVILTVISQSNTGRILRAMWQNEPAVESAGIDTTKFKLWAFTLSSITMGIGGVLLAHFYGSVDPSTVLVIDRSVEMIAMAVIGGMGTIVGAIGGAIVFIILRDEVLLVLGPTGRWFALWTMVLLIFVFARDGLLLRLWDSLDRLGGDDS